MSPQREHTDREYGAELDRLRELLLHMGAKVESQMSECLKAFSANDPIVARTVIESDVDVDRLEIEIDDACMHLLAKRQPVARDLRFVMTSLKVVTDLERIGDLAGNVAKSVIEGGFPSEPDICAEIERMGRAATRMLRVSIDSLVEHDAAKAAGIVSQDAEVDEGCRRVARLVATQLSGRPGAVEPLLRLVSISRSLERAADHCTNIAEMVVFLVKGHNVRHLRQLTTDP